jgi:hypothetical protein
VSKSEKKEEKNEKKLARYLSLLIENLAANFQFFSKSDHSLFSDLGASYMTHPESRAYPPLSIAVRPDDARTQKTLRTNTSTATC